MKRFLYLTLAPEALISSMLPPNDFGQYQATGFRRMTKGEALFFEIDQELVTSLLPLDYIENRCVPQEEGRPKSSVYISVYRVLEQMPVSALKSLYLTTDDGRVLELKQSHYHKDDRKELHLYQELCPLTPLVASTMAPFEFGYELTDTAHQIHVPTIIFCELLLNELAVNPREGSDSDLPYQNIDHLRDCLKIIIDEEGKTNKTVARLFKGDLLYRTIKNGFFVAAPGKFLFYKFPNIEELEQNHQLWWRSAQTMGLR